MTEVKSLNPFSVQSPEVMSANDLLELYVPVSDFKRISEPNHAFLHGHRGCGKSMMFRLLTPECQMLSRKCKINELPYFGVYFSVKTTDLNLSEFGRLENEVAETIISEHAMVNVIVSKTLQSIKNVLLSTDHVNESAFEQFKDFTETFMVSRLVSSGWSAGGTKLSECNDIIELLSALINVFDDIHMRTFDYLKRLVFKNVPYEGVLLSYQGFLYPFFKELTGLNELIKSPVFLLIDDADNFTPEQTKILNTWVSYRTADVLSIKISTQLNYKTYRTVSGQEIESPHDFSEINVSSIYTGSWLQNYRGWLSEVVKKRLHKYGIDVDAENFFPKDEVQESKISQIGDEIKKNWLNNTKKKGHRANDDVYRYARPEYIRLLGGKSKQRSTYKYAGFDQLAHISSGIIRFFLEPAALMYAEQQLSNTQETVTSIKPDIQNKILKEEADRIMFKLDGLHNTDDGLDDGESNTEALKKLRNLIYTVGGMFHQILVTENRAERRVFSFAISDEPDNEVMQVIRLGIRLGYIYENSIGTKEGMGRTRLFVLSRRAAPFFKLDPMGFSGYQFVTNEFLKNAIVKPKTILSKIKSQGVDAEIFSDSQLRLDIDQV